MDESTKMKHDREALGFIEAANARQNSAGFKRLCIQSQTWQLANDGPRPGPVHFIPADSEVGAVYSSDRV
jgi:hypothetical protein